MDPWGSRAGQPSPISKPQDSEKYSYIGVMLLSDSVDLCGGSAYGNICDSTFRVLTGEAALDKMIN